jgi:hypothetical protein
MEHILVRSLPHSLTPNEIQIVSGFVIGSRCSSPIIIGSLSEAIIWFLFLSISLHSNVLIRSRLQRHRSEYSQNIIALFEKWMIVRSRKIEGRSISSEVGAMRQTWK